MVCHQAACIGRHQQQGPRHAVECLPLGCSKYSVGGLGPEQALGHCHRQHPSGEVLAGVQRGAAAFLDRLSVWRAACLAAGARFAGSTMLLCSRCESAVVSWCRTLRTKPHLDSKNRRCHPQPAPAAEPAPAEGWGTEINSHLAGPSCSEPWGVQWAHDALPGRECRKALCSAAACCRVFVY